MQKFFFYGNDDYQQFYFLHTLKIKFNVYVWVVYVCVCVCMKSHKKLTEFDDVGGF